MWHPKTDPWEPGTGRKARTEDTEPRRIPGPLQARKTPKKHFKQKITKSHCLCTSTATLAARWLQALALSIGGIVFVIFAIFCENDSSSSSVSGAKDAAPGKALPFSHPASVWGRILRRDPLRLQSSISLSPKLFVSFVTFCSKFLSPLRPRG